MTAQTQTDRPRGGKKKHHCKRHDVSYGALEQCGACETDPGPAPTEPRVGLPDPPQGCLSSEQRERWYTSLADAALLDAARVMETPDDDRDFHTEANVNAHRATAIKAMRAAGELGLQRETDAIIEERRREAAQGGNH